MMRELPRTGSRLCLQLSARFSDLSILSHFVPAVVTQFAEIADDIDVDHIAGDLRLAIHEVCANMIDHAYEGEGENPIIITLSLDRMQRRIVARMIDQGKSFNPHKLEWPPPGSWQGVGEGLSRFYLLGQVPEQDLEAERGRGLYLLTFLLDVVRYYPRPHENCWYLVKKY